MRKEEFVQANTTNWGDPGLVSSGELSATKRSLSYESYLNYRIWASTRLLQKKIHKNCPKNVKGNKSVLSPQSIKEK